MHDMHDMQSSSSNNGLFAVAPDELTGGHTQHGCHVDWGGEDKIAHGLVNFYPLLYDDGLPEVGPNILMYRRPICYRNRMLRCILYLHLHLHLVALPGSGS